MFYLYTVLLFMNLFSYWNIALTSYENIDFSRAVKSFDKIITFYKWIINYLRHSDYIEYDIKTSFKVNALYHNCDIEEEKCNINCCHNKLAKNIIKYFCKIFSGQFIFSYGNSQKLNQSFRKWQICIISIPRSYVT